MQIKINFALKIAFLSTSLMLVLPNGLREVPFALLSFISIIYYFKEKIYKKEDVLLFIYFSILVGSLLYTENLKFGFRYLEAQLPFFYLPFAYFVFNRTEIINNSIRNKWIVFFNIANIVFLIFFLSYFLYQSNAITYNNIRTTLDTMPLFGIHPIYLSIISVLSIFSNFYSPNKIKLLQYIFVCTNLILLFLTGVRSTLLFFPLLITLFFLSSKSSVFFKVKVGLLIFMLSIGFIVLNKDFSKRLSEITNPQTYSEVMLHNSASIRTSVWDCALKQAKQSNILYGEGLGDTRDLLQKCYNSKYPELNKYYNTHNQYLSIYISVGILGIVAFALFLYLISRNIVDQTKIYFNYTLLFYLYMFIFENVLERKYGILIFLVFLLLVYNKKNKNYI